MPATTGRVLSLSDEAAPQDLAEALRALRVTAGLTGVQLSDKAGINRHKISKVERGHRFPNADEIRSWVKACGGTGGHADDLVQKLVGARTVVTGWAERMKDGQSNIQADYHQLISAATAVSYWETRLVPGMLQTPEYARLMLDSSNRRHGGNRQDIDEAIEKRIDAYKFLTDGISREFTFVVWEPVLRTPYVSRELMVSQLKRFAGVAVLSNVTLGVVPLDVELRDMVPAGFQIFGDHVRVEAPNDELAYDGDDDLQVSFHRELLASVMAMAVYGDDADELIERALQQSR